MSEQQTKEAEVLALIGEGLNNTAIARQAGVNIRVVARARAAAGLPAAPRSSWTRSPHPKADDIRVLLSEGHTDSAIRERTGADVSTIARMRAAGGFGPATITRKGKRTHPKEAEIRRLLNAGLSASAVARQLSADRAAVRRIRREAGLPVAPVQPLSLEEKWAVHTRPVDGGHLEWTGERVGTSRSPVMRYREKSYSPTAIAFRQRTGRDPVGQVKAECEHHQCVAPAHVEDEPGRIRLREQLRHLTGMGPRKPECRRGHDQAEHGRYQSDGVAYCHACHDGEVPAS
ncbi:hypothetical protein ACFW91_25095 [Streptomyces asoensis]|uniref:hypothetical protein n=1 Tax=Streptomyces asoensis TaxID=249586 RepID=UPI00369F0D12